MNVDREGLLGSLVKALPGVDKKEAIQQSNCFIFGQGRVATFNDEVACLADVQLDFEGAVPAEPLLNLLKKLDEDTLNIEVAEDGLEIKGKGRKSKIHRHQDVVLPIESIERPAEWVELPEGFEKAVSVVSSCAGTDESRFFIVCVHLTPNWMEATDGLRICRYNLSVPVTENVMVRGTSLKHISKFKMTHMSQTEDWLHFKDESGYILSCRKYVGHYPDVAKHLNVSGDKVTLPKGLKDAIDKCQVFTSEDQSDEVMVELRSNGIRLTGRGPSGYYQEQRKASFDGDSLKFSIEPKLLMEISDKSEECEVVPGRIKITTDDWEYVTCTSVPEDE